MVAVGGHGGRPWGEQRAGVWDRVGTSISVMGPGRATYQLERGRGHLQGPGGQEAAGPQGRAAAPQGKQGAPTLNLQ